MSDYSNILEELNDINSGSSIPKLDIKSHYDVKMHPDMGEVMFSFWDSEAKERNFQPKPIEGLLIGNAFQSSSFDSRNQAMYQTDHYLSKNKVTLYGPNVVRNGTKDQHNQFLLEQKLPQLGKSKVCLYVLTADGLVCVKTSTVIGIEQLRKNDFKASTIKLVPKLYDSADKDIPKKAHETFGPVAMQNKPRYAAITAGGDLGAWLKKAKIDKDVLTKTIQDWKKVRAFKLDPNQLQDAPVEADHQFAGEHIPNSMDDADDGLPF